MPRESDLELGRFGEYLLKSRIVPEKYARYYVSWVRKFLSQVPERTGVTREDGISTPILWHDVRILRKIP